MYGIEAQRGIRNAAQGLRSVLRAVQEEEAAPADGFTLNAPEPMAGSFGGAVLRAAGGDSESPSGGTIHPHPHPHPHLDPALAAPGRQYAAAQFRRRLPWLLIALALHGALLALFLLPQREPLPVTPPEPIQTQIITEPHVTPAPPPLKPVSLTRPLLQIVVPVPLVSIPDPAAIATTTDATPSAAAVAVARSDAPPAPAEPISPPQFEAAYLHNPAPEYPLQARRLREQGTVLLRVEVSAAGGALQVVIERSSRWPILDDAAASAVRRWRFEPARQGGAPVAAWVLVPIEFDLRS